MARTFKEKNAEKKKSKISKPAIAAIIIGAIMILSTIGFSVSSGDSNTVKYNGFNVIRSGNYWMVQKIDEKYLAEHPTKAKMLKPFGYPSVPKQNFFFSYAPNELEDLQIDATAMNRIKSSKMMYISFYPNSTDFDSQYIDFARMQLSLEMGQSFGKYVIQSKAVDEEGIPFSQKLNLPVVNCANATAAVPVILIQNRQEVTSLNMSGNCITMNSVQGFDLVRIKDRIIYTLLGVI